MVLSILMVSFYNGKELLTLMNPHRGQQAISGHKEGQSTFKTRDTWSRKGLVTVTKYLKTTGHSRVTSVRDNLLTTVLKSTSLVRRSTFI